MSRSLEQRDHASQSFSICAAHSSANKQVVFGSTHFAQMATTQLIHIQHVLRNHSTQSVDEITMFSSSSLAQDYSLRNSVHAVSMLSSAAANLPEQSEIAS